MNNHEAWSKCAKCQIFYDIRIDVTCPNCLKHEQIKRRNKTVQRIPGINVD